jgi:hypothetical protein
VACPPSPGARGSGSERSEDFSMQLSEYLGILLLLGLAAVIGISLLVLAA